MENKNYKIKNQIERKILDKFDNYKYIRNLRDGIEIYDDIEIEEFIDSLRYYILLNDNDIKTEKFIVFWIDYFIQNHSHRMSSRLKKKISDIIISLDLYPLLYENEYKAINNDNFNIIDEISLKIREKNNKLLSNSQFLVRNKILKMNNIIFSAPTSYGKSTIVIDSIQELYNSKKINKVLFILPTKALINEYRRKIRKSISDITIIENPHVNDNFEKVIYLYTPERFLIFFENNNNVKIDYVINDEAQFLINLDKKKCENRVILLAKTLSILSNKKVPMIFLMPYISKPYEAFVSKYVNIEKDNVIQISDNLLPFVSNNYYMLDIDDNNDLFRFDFTKDSGIEFASKKFIGNINNDINRDEIDKWGVAVIDNLSNLININDKFIIFCTNKKQIKKLSNRILENEICNIDKISNRMQALINYIEKNIGQEFEYINFLKNGIAIHFSEIDSYIRRQVEIIFNDENDIKGILCTSTLLQGVNLNAQNLIMIYGKRFSSIGNVEIDYRNLIGRSARLGINIQGNIFNIAYGKNIEKEGLKLYNSSEPVLINFEKILKDVKKSDNEILKTYANDKEVDSELKRCLNNGKSQIVENIDYFIGYEIAKDVEEKISKGDIEHYVNLLKKIGNYDETLELILELSKIYNWKDSKDSRVSKRMVNHEYVTRLAVNVFNGDNIKSIIEKTINFVNKNEDYYLVVRSDYKEDEYVTMVNKNNYNPRTMRLFKRKNDINTYIYTLLNDIQNIIEFELKKYIQDFYYRIKKIYHKNIVEVEEILDYSTVDNKKINLNNIGIIDNFAIDILTKKDYSIFFDESNNVKKNELVEFAKELPEDDPLRYAILDVL